MTETVVRPIDTADLFNTALAAVDATLVPADGGEIQIHAIYNGQIVDQRVPNVMRPYCLFYSPANANFYALRNMDEVEDDFLFVKFVT